LVGFLLFRNNPIDFSAYLEPVNYALKSADAKDAKNTLRWRLTADEPMADHFILIFRILTHVLLVMSKEQFENSELVFLKQVLFTCQNLPRPLYFLPP
jgi:hypothetical protein